MLIDYPGSGGATVLIPSIRSKSQNLDKRLTVLIYRCGVLIPSIRSKSQNIKRTRVKEVRNDALS